MISARIYREFSIRFRVLYVVNVKLLKWRSSLNLSTNRTFGCSTSTKVGGIRHSNREWSTTNPIHFSSIISDERVEHLPFVGSPIPVIGVIFSYIYFVSVWGPNYMKNRKPFDLKWLIKIYNVIQIISNLYIGVVVSNCGEGSWAATCWVLTHEETICISDRVAITHTGWERWNSRVSPWTRR